MKQNWLRTTGLNSCIFTGFQTGIGLLIIKYRLSGLLKFSSNLYFGKWKTRSERVTRRPRNIWKTTQLDTRRKHSRSNFILKSTYRLFFVLVARGLQDSAACQTFKWIVHPKSGSIIIYLSYVVVNSYDFLSVKHIRWSLTKCHVARFHTININGGKNSVELQKLQNTIKIVHTTLQLYRESSQQTKKLFTENTPFCHNTRIFHMSSNWCHNWLLLIQWPPTKKMLSVRDQLQRIVE